MAERNIIKDRPCKLCYEVVHGKAHKLKDHARGCELRQKIAAKQAIMDELKKQWETPIVPETAENNQASS